MNTKSDGPDDTVEFGMFHCALRICPKHTHEYMRIYLLAESERNGSSDMTRTRAQWKHKRKKTHTHAEERKTRKQLSQFEHGQSFYLLLYLSTVVWLCVGPLHLAATWYRTSTGYVFGSLFRLHQNDVVQLIACKCMRRRVHSSTSSPPCSNSMFPISRVYGAPLFSFVSVVFFSLYVKMYPKQILCALFVRWCSIEPVGSAGVRQTLVSVFPFTLEKYVFDVRIYNDSEWTNEIPFSAERIKGMTWKKKENASQKQWQQWRRRHVGT